MDIVRCQVTLAVDLRALRLHLSLDFMASKLVYDQLKFWRKSYKQLFAVYNQKINKFNAATATQWQ